MILDLVNDDPHWRVGLFTPALDDTTKRLLNVALTRAKRRLIVVGDLEYNTRNARRAFLGGSLLPFLTDHYPVVDALSVIPTGLAARAAHIQSHIQGGRVTPTADRLVVTQDRFYQLLRGDIEQASRRVVIYSAFMTEARIGELEPVLRATVARGVKVYVITKTRAERGQRELATYRHIEKALTDWGMHVVHKQRMHEKLVFVDDAILWSGSLNPLSFRDTQEVMERRRSVQVVTDFAKTLRLEELVGEYVEGQPVCPISGHELVACEGRDDPYYWRCVEDGCYTRSIDQPRLDDGMVRCASCGASVEYGEWGSKPAWRCTQNRRHHQPVARTHLKLPKMRALVPKRELRRLDNQYGMGENIRERQRDGQLKFRWQ